MSRKEIINPNTEIESEVQCRAIGPDNHAVLRSIISLYQQNCQQLEEDSPLLSTSFWERRIGSRFTAIAAMCDNKLIAMLAIGQECDNPLQKQLLFPVCSAQCEEKQAQIFGALSKFISSLAERQGWQALRIFVSDSNQSLKDLLAETFIAQPISVLPDYISVGSGVPTEKSASLSVLNSDLPGLASVQEGVVFAPKDLEQSLGIVMKRLRTERRIQLQHRQNGTSARSETLGSIESDSEAVRFCSFRNAGLSQVFIAPSLFVNSARSVRSLHEERRHELVFFVDAEDPAAPRLHKELLANQYVFSGVYPKLRKRDRLVYRYMPSFKAAMLSESLMLPENCSLGLQGQLRHLFHTPASNKIASNVAAISFFIEEQI